MVIVTEPVVWNPFIRHIAAISPPTIKVIFSRTAVRVMRHLLQGDKTSGRRTAINTKWNAPAATTRRPASPLLQRLPAMTNQDDLDALLSSRWKPASATGPALDGAATVCLS